MATTATPPDSAASPVSPFRPRRRAARDAALVLLCCAAIGLGSGCRRNVTPRSPASAPLADASPGRDAEPYLSDVWIRIGRARTVSITDLPPPRQATLRAMLARAPVAADDDGGWVDPLPPLATADADAAHAVFTPIDTGGLDLPDLRPLGTRREPAGTAPRLRVQRYWRRADGVGVSLREDALTPRLAVTELREQHNVAVGAAAAQLLVQRTPGGRARTLLRWNDARARCTLRVDDDVDHPAQRRWDRVWLINVARRLAARAPV